MGLPACTPAPTLALKWSVVQVVSSVREYSVLPPQYCAAIVFAFLVDRNFTQKIPIVSLKETFEVFVNLFTVKGSSLLL
jgi:hypothetical protein